MTSLKVFTADDLFHFNSANLDPLTETYNIGFYLEYMSEWPDYNFVVESAHGDSMGYILGKAEGVGADWHGHVTAVTVAPEFRRIGLAQKLMRTLEDVTDQIYKALFVDLYVRASNDVAKKMYYQLGYTIYRTVIDYYGGEEDAYDMRKCMSLDPDEKSLIAEKTEITGEELHRMPIPKKGKPPRRKKTD
eukprot:TRINITY_DN1824_c0_g1_i1.p1 TRINITY_DN1824_c0_g1~~TRINITY_DN1824_c0_g1_i1.p1  ORF type:complete len:190 (+),score=42.22 TRINITY_DN1824_c0_g1_i1:1-570(+)